MVRGSGGVTKPNGPRARMARHSSHRSPRLPVCRATGGCPTGFCPLPIQPLLPPKVVQLGPAAQSRLLPFLEEFNRAGVEVEPFGEDALVVRGLPDFLQDRDPQDLLEDLLERLEAGGKVDLDTFRKDLNAELACHSAIKKHDHLSPELALRLIQDLLTCEVPHTCPHGRPVIKKLSLGELERSFGRKG